MVLNTKLKLSKRSVANGVLKSVVSNNRVLNNGVFENWVLKMGVLKGGTPGGRGTSRGQQEGEQTTTRYHTLETPRGRRMSFVGQ